MKKYISKNIIALLSCLAAIVVVFSGVGIQAKAVQATRTINFIPVLIEFENIPDYPRLDLDVHLDDDDFMRVQRMIAHDGGTNLGPTNPSDGRRTGRYPIVPMDQFFRKQSYGAVDIKWERSYPFVDGKTVVYHSKHNILRYYQKNEYNKWGFDPSNPNELNDRLNELFDDAFTDGHVREQLEKLYPDKADLDSDGDGWVDSLALFIAIPSAFEEPDASTLLYPKTYPGGIKNAAHGLHAAPIVLPIARSFSEGGIFSHRKSPNGNIMLSVSQYSTIYHEIGHQVFGLKDLYHQSGSSSPVGAFSMMSTNSYSQAQGYLADEKERLGWIPEIPEAQPSQEVTVHKAQFNDRNERTSYKIPIPGVEDQYFVVEYWDRHGVVGEGDDNSGMIVYRINGKYSWRKLYDSDSEYYRWKYYRYNNLYGNGHPEYDYAYIFRNSDTKPNEGKNTPWNNTAQTSIFPGSVISQPGTYGTPLNATSGACSSFAQGMYYTYDGANTGLVLNVTQADDKHVTFSYSFETGGSPVSYKVNYYKQNEALDGYDLAETENHTAHGGSVTITPEKKYAGYTLKDDNTLTQCLVGNGPHEFNVYYDRVPATKLNYTVKHYQQNVDNDEYTLESTQSLQGEKGEITLSPKTYEGFDVASDSVLTVNLTNEGQEYAIYYNRQKRTVTYTSAIQAESVPAQQTVKYGATVSVPSLSNVGDSATFIGWKGTQGDTNTYTAGQTTRPITENTQFAAKWAVKVKYSFTGDTPSGVKAPNDETTYGIGDKPTLKQDYVGETIPATVDGKKGQWTFNGWTASGIDDQGRITGIVSVTGSWTFVPATQLSVVFNLENGQNPVTKVVYEGEQVDAPQDPVRDGYKFTGWYTSAAQDAQKVEFPLQATQTTSVYAHWKAIPVSHTYRVEYYLQNIDNNEYTLASEDTQELTTQDETVTVIPREYDGFTLNKTKSTLQGSVLDNSTVFRAYYDRKMVTVTFVGTPADSGQLPQSITAKFGTQIRLPDPGKREGYTFDYWKGSRYAIGDVYTITSSDHSFEAMWIRNEYHVQYEWNGQAPSADSAPLPSDNTTYYWHDTVPQPDAKYSAGYRISGEKDGVQGTWIFDSWSKDPAETSNGFESDVTYKGTWHFEEATSPTDTKITQLPATGSTWLAAILAVAAALVTISIIAGFMRKKRQS